MSSTFEIDNLIEILKKILEVDDLEVKNCAIESLIEMLEDKKEKFEKD